MGDVHESQKRRIKELEEAIVMADNRLEAALMGDEVCRACVEVARSYLSPVIPSPQ
jgi:hypothetical protein